MATMARAMQSAVEKYCQKQIKKETDKLSKQLAQLKREMSDLKKQVGAVIRASQAAANSMVDLSEADRKKADRMRVTGVAIRRLRKKLNISQRELGILLGVSTQAVYLWERKKTELELRRKARYALYELKKLNADEIAKRLLL